MKIQIQLSEVHSRYVTPTPRPHAIVFFTFTLTFEKVQLQNKAHSNPQKL